MTTPTLSAGYEPGSVESTLSLLPDSTQLSLLTTQNMAWYIISIEWCHCQRAYWRAKIPAR